MLQLMIYWRIFLVSFVSESKATEAERKQGFDLAYYLIKFNYKASVLTESEATESRPVVKPLVEAKQFEQPEPPKLDSWEKHITELENYFTGIALPTQPLKLNRCSTITNCSLFIESHFATVKANNGNLSFLPYLERLNSLKEVIC